MSLPTRSHGGEALKDLADSWRGARPPARRRGTLAPSPAAPRSRHGRRRRRRGARRGADATDQERPSITSSRSTPEDDSTRSRPRQASAMTARAHPATGSKTEPRIGIFPKCGSVAQGSNRGGGGSSARRHSLGAGHAMEETSAMRGPAFRGRGQGVHDVEAAWQGARDIGRRDLRGRTCVVTARLALAEGSLCAVAKGKERKERSGILDLEGTRERAGTGNGRFSGENEAPRHRRGREEAAFARIVGAWGEMRAGSARSRCAIVDAWRGPPSPIEDDGGRFKERGRRGGDRVSPKTAHSPQHRSGARACSHDRASHGCKAWRREQGPRRGDASSGTSAEPRGGGEAGLARAPVAPPRGLSAGRTAGRGARVSCGR